MPEVPVGAPSGEFDGDSPTTPGLGFDGHNAAFSFLFGEAIDNKDLLAEFYARLHFQQPAVQADCHGGGNITKRVVSRGPSVNLDGNSKRKALAAAALDHRNHLSNPGTGAGLRLMGAAMKGNSTPLLKWIQVVPDELALPRPQKSRS